MKTAPKTPTEQNAADRADLERRKSSLPKDSPYREMLDRWLAELPR